MRLARHLSGLFALLTIITLGCTLQLVASPLQWPGSGVVIRQGHHIEWQRAGFRAENGDILYAWSDTRLGDRDVWVQKVSASGEILWQTDGLPVVIFHSRQEDPEMVEVTDGWIVTWIDFRDDTTGDVWAQKLDQDGNKQWDEDGVLVNAFPYFVAETTLRMVHDDAGGAIVAWVDGRGGDAGDIYAQHILPDGTIDPAWPSDGLPVCAVSGSQTQVTAYSDDGGGMIIAWQDARSGDADIWISRITSSGYLPWGDSGMPLCTVTGEQKTPKLDVDGQGGVFVVWVDARNGPTDLYFQHVDADGEIQLEANGRVLCDAASNQNQARITNDGNGGAICVWADYRLGGLECDIYGQKINPNGSVGWATNGIIICDAEYSQEEIRLASDMRGGAVIAWEDTRNQNGNRLMADVFAQRVDASGAFHWATNGIAVIDSGNVQTQPLVRPDGEGGAYIAWSDSRTGSAGIRVQHLDSLATKHLAPGGVELVWGLDGDATRPLSVPLNFGRVACIWEDGRLGSRGKALFYQIIDRTGEIDLAVNGVPVAIDFPADVQANQQNHQVCPDGDLGFFVVWEDQRTGTSLIRGQHVNILGETLWPDEGIVIAESERDQDMAGCAPDGEGGVYVAWSGRNADWQIDVYVQRLTGNGDHVWAEPLQVQDTYDDDILAGMVSDGTGRAVLAWEAGGGEESDVHGACVAADGSIAWATTVCDYIGEQRAPVLASDGEGGSYFVWRDRRNLNDDDIYAQLVDASGAKVWDVNGMAICTETNDQIRPRCTTDEDGNLLVTWEDYRNGVDRNIYMQKVSAEGVLQFPTTGLPVVTVSGDQYEVEFVAEWDSGFYLAWTDLRSAQYPDIYGMHLDAAGDNPSPADWTEGGIVVNESENWQHRSSIAHDGSAGAIVFWQDWRASGKQPLINLWTQRLNDFTVNTPVRTSVIPEGYTLEAFPNPFNPITEIRFSVPRQGRVQLVVYDVLGRAVATLVDEQLLSGSYQFRWDASDVASGSYFCRMHTADFTKTMKMTLLK